MRSRTVRQLMALGGALAILLLLSCSIEEDLTIHSDGSGTYRAKVTIPKELGTLEDLREDARKDGFAIVEEGETEKARFIVVRKDFKNLSSLNDSNSSYEWTARDTSLLQREYRLRIALQSPGFISIDRKFNISMPASVKSASVGTISGRRVTWDASRGGTIEVVASGFALPLSRELQLAFIAIAGGALLWLLFRRRRKESPAVCPGCASPLTGDARFCRTCGAGFPAPEA